MPVVVVQSADGWPEWLTAFGTLAAGLALPLAFVQLGSLQRERLREQVDKVAAWPEAPSPLPKVPGELWWSVPLQVRNSGELPVFVASVDVEVQPWGFDAVLAARRPHVRAGTAMSTAAGRQGRPGRRTARAPGSKAGRPFTPPPACAPAAVPAVTCDPV